MTTQPEKQKIRRLYCKPQLEQVQLIAEEAVLQTCKLQGGGSTGPNNENCKGQGVGGNCQVQGS